MPKVTIKGIKVVKAAKSTKPKAKPSILAGIVRPPLKRGNTSPVGKPTQTDTRRK